MPSFCWSGWRLQPTEATGRGRMFTGDRSGDWVYGTLHKFGFASQPNADNRDDGLYLTNAYITSSQRCAPPQNKPLREELLNCRSFLLEELKLLGRVKVVSPTGQDRLRHLHVGLPGAARRP